MYIQPAQLADLENILHLQKECYITEAEIYNDYNIPPLLQDIESLKQEYENTTILIARDDINGIIGSIRGYAMDKTLFIGKLMVQKELRNQGIGCQLLDAIETYFPNCTRAELFTGSKSKKNLYLYQKIGFKPFKEQTINDSLTMIFLEKNIRK